MSFDLADWKRRFERNSEEAERNSLMDSGWSASTHDNCIRVALRLYRELAVALADSDTISEDFFDRPDLVALQEAARFTTRPITAAAPATKEG